MPKPGILVLTIMSEKLTSAPSRYSIRPGESLIPRTFETEGLATSASISNTFLSRSLAILRVYSETITY